MKYIVLLGRILYSAMFLKSAPGHFTGQMLGYASAHGVPAASILVPFAGVLLLLGGLQMQMQMAHFMKNLSMLGAALLIAYFGSGPLSLDARTNTAPKYSTV